MLEETRDPKPSSLSSGLALGAFGSAVAGAAALGAKAATRPKVWYRFLRKAPANPPDWAFGPVWTTLYGLMAVSAWRIWRRAPSRRRSLALGLWAGQLGLNAAWSPLFFGRRQARTALVDLAAMAGLAVAYAKTSASVDRPAAWLFAPTLAWMGFAGYLNAEVVRRNPLLGRA